MANLSALAPLTTAATALANLILVSPQKTQGYRPQNPPNTDGTPSQQQQPPSLLFHYEGEQTVRIQSDITDHYIEDNTAIQDQISLRPEKITTHGFIGELNDIAPAALSLLQIAADKLTVVSAYIPVLSETALIAYNEAFLAYQVAQNVVHSAVAAWSSITQQDSENVINESGLGAGDFSFSTGAITGNQTKQQVAFQQFYGYWRARTLFTVQTPWAVFQNMAIEDLVAIQDDKTNVITDFNVTFKMIRTASTAIEVGLGVLLQGRLNSQATGETDLGTSTPVQSISVGAGLSQMGVV